MLAKRGLGIHKKRRLDGPFGGINKLIFQDSENFYTTFAVGMLPGEARFGFFVAGELKYVNIALPYGFLFSRLFTDENRFPMRRLAFMPDQYGRL
jgi:hypothetical protein